jgi:hypothetical protein
VCGPIDLGHGVTHEDHSIIVLDPTSDRAWTQTQVVTPKTTHVVSPRLGRPVSRGVLEKHAKTPLDDQMLAFLGALAHR